MRYLRPALGLILIVLLLVSCTTTAKPVKPKETRPTASPSPTAITTPTAAETTPTASKISGPITLQTVPPTGTPRAKVLPTTVFSKAAVSRGLEVKGEVPFTTLSRSELRPYLIKEFEKDHGKEEMEKSKAFWVMLDLMKEKDDLYDLWLSLLSEQVAGFYDLDSRAMTLIGSSENLSTADELTLAHEYVHALQDQNFGISARSKQVEHDGEKALALKALVEGDATMAMVDYALKNMSREDIAAMQRESNELDMEKLRSAPPVLQVTLLFPYEMGANFVGSLFRSGGWTAVNKAYSDPPTTSEQILHPEKYIAREGPQQMELPDLASGLGGEWAQLDNGTVGELGWLIYIANGLGAQEAVDSAAGWGGDQYVLLRSRTGKQALAVLSSWDTQDDADEIFTSLYYLQDSYTSTKFTLDEDTRFAWTRLSTSGYVSQLGKKILLVIASDETTTKKIVSSFGGF